MPRYLGDDFMLPALDLQNTPWFTEGSVQVQFCDDCGHAQHPPEDVCRSCQGTRLSFRAMTGEGTIESCVVVHHPVHPGLVGRHQAPPRGQHHVEDLHAVAGLGQPAT